MGLVFTLLSLALAAPTNDTTQHKGIVFPKKVKTNATEKIEDHKTTAKDHTTTSHEHITSTEATTESNHLTSDVTFTIGQEITKPDSEDPTEQEYMSMENQEPQEPEHPESVHDEPPPPQEPEVDGSEEVPETHLPSDANDGLIEYNLGNPLALRLHLPWWPLKDMLKSIQDAISVMNLTMNTSTMEADNTKTKIVQFDHRNYTLKVRVFKPHENNRLLVRLISLTPVIDEGNASSEKGVKMEDGQKNEALEESASQTFSLVKKLDEELEEQEKGDDHDDDDDDDKKEEKKKTKGSKKEKQNKKKKKEEKKGSDSEGKAD